jgi:hypothetical protein
MAVARAKLRCSRRLQLARCPAAVSELHSERPLGSLDLDDVERFGPQHNRLRRRVAEIVQRGLSRRNPLSEGVLYTQSSDRARKLLILLAFHNVSFLRHR